VERVVHRPLQRLAVEARSDVEDRPRRARDPDPELVRSRQASVLDRCTVIPLGRRSPGTITSNG
jgi:hypothetical protein